MRVPTVLHPYQYFVFVRLLNFRLSGDVCAVVLFCIALIMNYIEHLSYIYWPFGYFLLSSFWVSSQFSIELFFLLICRNTLYTLDASFLFVVCISKTSSCCNGLPFLPLNADFFFLEEKYQAFFLKSFNNSKITLRNCFQFKWV